MNRQLLIHLDNTVFRLGLYFLLLISKLRKAEPPDLTPRIPPSAPLLVIRPGGLGDGLMSIPLLKALRKMAPGSRITLLCVKKNLGAFRHLPFIDDVLVMDDLNKLYRTLFKLKRRRYRVVFDLEPFRKVSTIIAYLTGAPVMVGFDTNIRRKLYTHIVTYHNEQSFESLNMLRQLEVFDSLVSGSDTVDMHFDLPHEVREKAGDLLDSLNIQAEKDYLVAVAPGVLKPHHRWIMSRYAELIDRILSDSADIKIVLVGVPADRNIADEVFRLVKTRDRVLNLIGKTTFDDALGILEKCEIMIACDGGLVYMAAAMGCATISLWGPGVMERFKPPGDDHIGVRKDYVCIPCVNYSRLGEFPPCPYRRRCINDITAADVFEKYLQLKSFISRRQNL